MRNRIGRMALIFVLVDRNASYSPKRKKRAIPATSVPMITPLFHSNCTPASWSANNRGTGQQTERIPPKPSKPRNRSRIDFPSFRVGTVKKSMPKEVPTMGALYRVRRREPRRQMRSHLIQKIHRQLRKFVSGRFVVHTRVWLYLVRSAMTPPRTGPKRLANAKTELMTPE